MSWILPPFWLIQNKLWEVLLVTLSVYLITLSVAWWMFLITWILLAIYFNKYIHQTSSVEIDIILKLFLTLELS